MTIKLVSYRPLCITKKGRQAIVDYSLPPYIDSSIRREPSFEMKYPGISATCRNGKLAPHLQENDIVLYITVKDRYDKSDIKHWKLTSILEVLHRFENHQDAAKWYLENGHEIPSNCVIGNNHIPHEQTGMPEYNVPDAIQGYIERTEKNPEYLICSALFKELNNPPMITEKNMFDIFNICNPGTQSTKIITIEQYQKFVKILNGQNLS